MREWPFSRRGVALAVVLWVILVLGILSSAAGLAARLELKIAVAYRDHAAALAVADAGLAEAMSGLASGSVTLGSVDTLAGEIETGEWRASLRSSAGGLQVVVTGSSGSALRRIEAQIVMHESGNPSVTAWREIL